MASQHEVPDTGRIRAATKRAATVELLRNFGSLADAAMVEPIILTKNGHDRLVLLSAEHYKALRQAYERTQCSTDAL